MNILKKNITNIFGKAGERWILNLPDIITKLIACWELRDVAPVDNMTFNYVAKAITNKYGLVVLKISCDDESLSNEIQSLRFFAGNGSVKLIAHNEEYHALLLQQAVPGISLNSLYPSQIEYVMDCYIATMKKLHSKSLPQQNNYRHIRDWLTAFDNDCGLPSFLVKNAFTLKNKLLSSMTTEIFLHGDLHHDNIIKHENYWLAIDPKGVVGEPEFEIAAFDFMYINELANMYEVKNIFETRVNLLAQKSSLDSQRIKDWVFVRLMLMAAWHVEDNGDPSSAIKLAETLDK